MELSKTILEVIKTLLGVSDKLKGAKQERRNKTGALFDNASECLLSFFKFWEVVWAVGILNMG